MRGLLSKPVQAVFNMAHDVMKALDGCAKIRPCKVENIPAMVARAASAPPYAVLHVGFQGKAPALAPWAVLKAVGIARLVNSPKGCPAIGSQAFKRFERVFTYCIAALHASIHCLMGETSKACSKSATL